MTDSFLNIFEVGFPFWMELAMAMTLYQVTHALSNRIATTALAIFTYASSEKNGGGPHVGRVTPAGLWLYWWNVKTLTLIPIFAGAFEAAAGVTILLATALQDILRPFFARVSQFLSNSPDRSANCIHPQWSQWLHPNLVINVLSISSLVSARVSARMSLFPQIFSTWKVTAVRLLFKPNDIAKA